MRKPLRRTLASLLMAVLCETTMFTGLHAQQAMRLPAQDRLLAGQPRTVFSIGSEDGQPWEILSNVGGMGFDQQDNLYVLDRGNHRVLVFDPRGRFVRQFGQRGGGPGEFINPLGMTVTRDEMIVVLDVGGRRKLVTFARDGRHVRSAFVSEVVSHRLQPHPVRGIVTAVTPMPGGRPGLAAAASEVPIMWYPLEPGASPTELARVPIEARRSTTRQGAQVVIVGETPALSPGIHWNVLPRGGVATAGSTSYRINTVGGSGPRQILRPIEPRRVTARDREFVREREIGQLASNTRMPAPARAALQRQAETMEFADVVPVIQGLAATPVGTLWVARNGSNLASPPPIDLISADGRYLGTIQGQRLPAAFSATGRAAWIEIDEFGVERVVVRLLPQGWR